MKYADAKARADKQNKKHIFSLYTPNLSEHILLDDGTCVIKDEILAHRMRHVLRLVENDVIYLFSNNIVVYGVIIAIEKKSIVIKIKEKKIMSDFQKKIKIYIPLLKKEALEEAVYNATEMGVSEIQLIKTEYSRKAITDHEFTRLQKIIITGCEQAKRFNIPKLHPLISLQTLNKKEQEMYIWFDPDGKSLFSLCLSLEEIKPNIISIFIGPEADFSATEKEKLCQISEKYTLTPTVLRSRSAVALGIGVVRSILSKEN